MMPKSSTCVVAALLASCLIGGPPPAAFGEQPSSSQTLNIQNQAITQPLVAAYKVGKASVGVIISVTEYPKLESNGYLLRSLLEGNRSVLNPILAASELSHPTTPLNKKLSLLGLKKEKAPEEFRAPEGPHVVFVSGSTWEDLALRTNPSPLWPYLWLTLDAPENADRNDRTASYTLILKSAYERLSPELRKKLIDYSLGKVPDQVFVDKIKMSAHRRVIPPLIRIIGELLHDANNHLTVIMGYLSLLAIHVPEAAAAYQAACLIAEATQKTLEFARSSRIDPPKVWLAIPELKRLIVELEISLTAVFSSDKHLPDRENAFQEISRAFILLKGGILCAVQISGNGSSGHSSSSVNLTESLGLAASEASLLAKNSGTRISFEINGGDNLTMVADDREIAEVWTNLFKNAIEQGSTVIRVDIHPSNVEDTEAIVVTVADDGPGMPDRIQRAWLGTPQKGEWKPLLENPIVENATEKPEGIAGKGFGIASMKRIVNRLWGRAGPFITVQTNRLPEEHGTTFRIVLPAAKPPSLPTMPKTHQPEFVLVGAA